MAIANDYQTGTVSIANGAAALTGVGTSWLAWVRAGDMFMRAGFCLPVLAVNSDTSITLAENWPGTTLSGSAYRIRFQPDGSRYAAAANALIEMLADGNVESLSGLTGAANKGIHFTGAGTLATHDQTAFSRTLLDDANAGAILTTLGISAFIQTLLDDANAGAALTTLGISAYIQTLLNDADASTAQTTLGISTFIKTLLDDADSATARTTLGLSTKANFNTALTDDLFAYLGAVNTFTAFQQISVTAAGTAFNLVSTDAGASLGPTINFTRTSASPAANDQLGGFLIVGQNSAAGSAIYGRMLTQIVSPTAAAEAGAFIFQTLVAGGTSSRMNIGGGVYNVSATGGDKGMNTINFGAIYDDNTLLTCMGADEDFTERGTVDLEKWDALVPDQIEPEWVEEVPEMEEIEEEVTVEEPIKTGKNQGALRRARKLRKVERQKTRIVKVVDERGKEVGEKEEPIIRKVTHPARSIPRQHRTARIFKAMLDAGFDPRDPEQYFSRYAADQALPGMPTRGDGPLKWEHNALSIGEQHSQLVLASELQTNVMRAMWDLIKQQEERLVILEAKLAG